MSAIDTSRTHDGAAGLAGRIGSVFVTGFGAAPEQSASASVVIASSISRFVSNVADAIIDYVLDRDAGGTIPLAADAPATLVHGRWLLEEYRVSLFAQGLGTAEPVSLQRLTKALSGS